jgi:hypothetical protein
MRGHLLFITAAALALPGCGDTHEDRAASGGLGGAAMGALVGGPIGLVIGGGLGYVAGNKLDKPADEKIEELANRPPERKVTEAPKRARSAEPSGSAERPKVLDREQIEEKLNAAGYNPVHEMRREGSAYLARVEREGTLYAVRVDAASGRLLASQEIGTVSKGLRQNGDGSPTRLLTEQQVRSTLRQIGYDMIGDVERNGERYRVEAMQNGRLFDLVVDGRTGQVVSATPSTASGAPSRRQGG